MSGKDRRSAGNPTEADSPIRGFLASAFALSSPPLSAAVEEAELPVGDLNLGLAAGFGLITISLIVLVSGLLWSATRRLRNLPDDPSSLRRLIVAGLAGAGVGVVLAALAVATG
jgi:hypothetical protein